MIYVRTLTSTIRRGMSRKSMPLINENAMKKENFSILPNKVQVIEKQHFEKNTMEDSDDDFVDKRGDVVLLETAGRNGLITLNRPNAFNALNTPMGARLFDTLKDWESSKRLVIVQGAEGKAFCSGGDIKLAKYHAKPGGEDRMTYFFSTAYKVYYIIKMYKIPYVALMYGVTMGAGAGLSISGKYRVVSETSLFAMPEVAIGFHVDAGCTYTFPRLQGNLGFFLALTGHRLKGNDIVAAGLATHYVPVARINDLRKDLLENDATAVEEILQKYQSNMSTAEFSLAPYMEKINSCFSASTVEEIMTRLESDGSDWAKKVLKTMNAMSPTSLKVVKVALDRGKELSFAECLKMEYRLTCSFFRLKSDFHEGIRATLIDKGSKPNWNPKTLKEITKEDVLRRFELLPPEEELKLECRS